MRYIFLQEGIMPGRAGAGSPQQDRISKLLSRTQQSAVNVHAMFGEAAKVASAFDVSISTIKRWIRKSAAGAPFGHAPKAGRPRKLNAAQTAELRAAGSQIATGSAARAAAALRDSTGINISKATAHRYLTTEGYAFRIIKPVPKLLPHHKAARVAFANQHINLDWSRVMFTDSKYFRVTSNSRRVGHYRLTSKAPTTRDLKKNPVAVHAYMGVTIFGVTTLKFVTGGSQKNTKFLGKDKKTLLSGMGAEEYADKVLPIFESEGIRLFSSKYRRAWMLQQDGAKVHWSPPCRVRAAAAAPGGLLAPWPALSPDLSPIENVWAMMSQDLALRPPCADAAELIRVLEEIRMNLTADRLRPLFDSMPNRLEDVIELGGATVRF
jgi:transposase